MDSFILRVIVTLFFCSLLSACGGDDKTSAESEKIITVAPKSESTTLFFSGTILPLKTVVVTSPADGVVSDMAFHFGDPVKANQALYTIASEKFKTDYKTALMQYIKAKNEFSNARSQLKESEFLHKNQLISEDDFKSKQSSYYNAQLSLIEAQEALALMLKQLAVQGVKLDQLTIDKIDQITQALHVEDGAQLIHVRAPVTGVALLGTKSGSDESSKKIEKGDQVKQGDVLAVIGDVSGLTIHVNVNEFNINQLKIGQKVKVTGAAFQDITLQGEITGIDRQGQTGTGGMPIFPVEIIVPKLTVAQQAIIHMGMSAKVQIDIAQAPEISVPVNAVIQRDGGTYVKVKDEKTGKIREVPVKTGATTLDSVIIQSNLNAGEKIVAPN